MKAIAFVDYENIWTGLLERGYELSPEQLVQFLQQYSSRNMIDLMAIYLYANFDREEFWRTQTTFQKTNVFTRHVFGKNNYANTSLRRNAADLELMLEAQEIMLTRASTFDLILLLTGDGDFLPLVRKIRAWGKDVKVIGVEGSINQALQPYSENFDTVWTETLSREIKEEYDFENDVEKGIQILGQLQMSMTYVASTKARTALSEQLGRTIPQVKEVIKYALKEGIITEREYPDANLKIGRTKIYLLNLEDRRVEKALGTMIEDVRQRYERIGI